MRWEELKIGLRAEFEVALSHGDLDRFAALSGDDNPLHIQDACARARGFQGRVAHGLLVAAFFSRLIGVMLPGENALILESALKFRKPVIPPAILNVSGEITHLSEATRTLELVVIAALGGVKAVTGTFTVKVLDATQP